MIIFSSRLTERLQNSSPLAVAVYTSLVSFCLYSCVYTFRKAFTVGTFEGLYFIRVQYKVWLVVFQVCGYALSKVIGIKIISELKAGNRANSILRIMLLSGLCWLFFGILPAPWNLIPVFINGLALGLIWGVIFSFLEGRRTTEMLAAGLSISFILSSGMAKTIGGLLLLLGISEYWMPFVTCLIFILPLIFFLNLLNHIPPPSKQDEDSRTKRKSMSGKERLDFLQQFWPGMILFILSYVFLTSFRDFRDNFSAEIWASLNYADKPEIFLTAELPSVVLVLIFVSGIMLIKNNAIAFMVNHALIFFGMALVGLSGWLFQIGFISPLIMMVAMGTGLYMAYVPFNSIFFDRMLATFKYSGTVGFVMYLSDSFGYAGSLVTLFIKEFGNLSMNWLDFYIACGYWLSIAGCILILISAIYFGLKYHYQLGKIRNIGSMPINSLTQ